jgi:hypothetical protein
VGFATPLYLGRNQELPAEALAEIKGNDMDIKLRNI